MPVYEYECKNCGQRFDKIQPVTSEALTECVLCGKGPIRRVFQPVGVIFKGSGWYSTDNRNSNKSSQASGSGSGGESRPSAAGSDDGKSKSEKSDTSDKTDKSDKSENSGKSSAAASKSSDD